MTKKISETAQSSLEAASKDAEEHPTQKLPVTSAQIRVSAQRPLPQLNSHVKREMHQVTKEWTSEVLHTDQLCPSCKPTTQAKQKLSPQRIQRFHQKKTRSLLKQMAEMHELAIRNEGLQMVTETNLPQKRPEDELWRDMIKPREERLFQIDRFS
jgi:hypothetical protein